MKGSKAGGKWGWAETLLHTRRRDAVMIIARSSLKWQSKFVTQAADAPSGAAALWFKWQVIEQQTRIKKVLMSSLFHLGSIRRLVEAKPIRAARGPRGKGKLSSCRAVGWRRRSCLFVQLQLVMQVFAPQSQSVSTASCFSTVSP